MLENEQLLLIGLLIFCFLVLVIWLYFVARFLHLQKRIENHVLIYTSLENISIFDQIKNRYDQWKQKQVKKMEMSKLWKKYYCFKHNCLDIHSYCGFIIDKMVCGVTLLAIYLLFSILNIHFFSVIFILFSFFIGFYFPNMIVFIKKKMSQKQIEKDLLKAISLMNNAFQSGQSIIQAIQTVSMKLQGPIASEFSKIYQDMLHGLSFEKSFLRFQDRVKLEEIQYITASLSILNKTGGNIIEVFSSIENNFYTRRKLEMELKATIASSRLVFEFLIFLPILLWILIGFMNQEYFMVFKESTLGILLFIVILCIYLLYVVIIRSIMKMEKY